MNIKDEAPIFAIRQDFNKGDFFMAFVGQHFKKSGYTVIEILQDYNEYVEFGHKVYKIRVTTREGTPVTWKKIEHCANVHITYEIEGMDKVDQIEQLFNDEA